MEANRANETQDTLMKHVPGVILTNSAGSSFRAQVEYRGFGAGSVTGFPQGLAVYQNGVRINEVFGDVVNWDLIPNNAINDGHDRQRQSGLSASTPSAAASRS